MTDAVPARPALPRSASSRRRLASDKMLDLGQHRRQDESRRLRDLLARFVLPTLDDDRRMPTDDDIAKQFRSTRNAARIALQMLVDERAIERTVGVGTHAHAEPSPWISDRLIDNLTLDGGFTDRGMRVIGWRETGSVPPAMAEEFSGEVERLAIFERVVLFAEVPSSIRTYYLPLRATDVFELADAATDIFALLEERFGYDTLVADRTISAIAADPSAAELLGVPEGSPLLFIDTTVRSAAGDVVLTYHGRQRTDLVQMSIKPERIRD